MSRPLDEIDVALIRRLQEDGRTSNKELAAEVGLAPSSCLERVRRLRDDGILLGTHAAVEPASVGVVLQAMVVIRLRSHEQESWDALRQALLDRTEVVALFHLAGADDLLVHVACRDTDHLRDLVMQGIGAHHAVRQVETSLVFEHVRRPLPIYGMDDPDASSVP